MDVRKQADEMLRLTEAMITYGEQENWEAFLEAHQQREDVVKALFKRGIPEDDAAYVREVTADTLAQDARIMPLMEKERERRRTALDYQVKGRKGANAYKG